MWNLIATSARAAGPSPMYTWVSDVGRIELSGITFLNGVSKAANMLRDGLDIEAADDVYVDLGNHWQSPVWIAAGLSIQARLVSNPHGALAVVTTAGLEDVADSREIVVISRDPFGMPEKNLEGRVVNGSQEVRGFGDVFSPMGAYSDSDEVFHDALSSSTLTEFTTLAKQLIAERGIVSGSRIAIPEIADLKTRTLWHVVVPAMTRCSVVLLDGTVDVSKICSDERVDHLIDAD